MNFKSKKHAERFRKALVEAKVGPEDAEIMAAFYILTEYKRVWQQFEGYIDHKNGLDPEAFDSFEERNQSEMALVTAAYDLLYCADCINITDLTDLDIIPTDAFAIIFRVITYLRVGHFNEETIADAKESVKNKKKH
ncbi:hypothetical protein SAMN02910456_00650 [Ruminococcaceae bacterium YRB3002]|nr:hypothetical protein SAMN02910456_00650 [Ruminococcaceae bacterium YRB3002]